MRVSFGEYKDYELSEVPDWYLTGWLGKISINEKRYPGFRWAVWCEIQRGNLSAYEAEQELRGIGVAPGQVELTMELVSAGHRTLSKKLPPDSHGGDGQAMQALNSLRDSLLSQLHQLGGGR